MTTLPPNAWDVALETMPGFEQAMQRIYAWYAGEIIDRPPVRFQAHNAFVEGAHKAYPSPNLRDRWFDAEFQVETYLQSIRGKTFHGETFPVFWPNLGPEVYAALFGAELEYGDVTAWAKPNVHTWDDLPTLRLDMHNAYARGLEQLTQAALERCAGQFLVGYSDFHPGMDCVAAWRDPAQLCFDLLEAPDRVAEMVEIATSGFRAVYDHFDAVLKAHRQLSVSWMGIPSFGRMHIPSCDFAALISPKAFETYCLPAIRQEVQWFDHNIFHVDGRGVLKNLDRILEIPQVHAIQWVQGVGDDRPIAQWIPTIQRIQTKRPIIVDLMLSELESFMQAVRPKGIFLWVATETEEQEQAVIKRLKQWQ